jgi:outer membrane lipoprotein
MIARWWWISLALVLLTGGCATPRLADDTGPTPADVIAGRAADGQVHWGGRIVGIENLRDRTRLEVLAFPLASDGEPLVTEAPQGRFIVERPGFLEPHDYAPDRRVEVRGRVAGTEVGEVGDASYRYPVVRGDQVTLWPDLSSEPVPERRPRINFGFGFGSGGSGAGIGIGF